MRGALYVKRPVFLTSMEVGIFAATLVAESQQLGKVGRIGCVVAGAAPYVIELGLHPSAPVGWLGSYWTTRGSLQ
jgi:hypothetical protein